MPFESLRFAPAGQPSFGFEAIRDRRRTGTLFHLGYGTRLAGGESGPLRATNRSLFMKASYLWQL